MRFSAAVGTGALLLATAGLAAADNVQSEVAAGGSTTITLGDGTHFTDIEYWINNAGACDVSTSVPITVTPSLPAGITSNIASLTFTSCNARQTVRFTASQTGTFVIDADNNSLNMNASPAKVTLTVVDAPNTAPSVAVTGVADDATYELGSVPTPGCQVTDAQDGNSTKPATLSAISGPLAAFGIGDRTATCTHTDTGGLSATPASATYHIIDTTKPALLGMPADQVVEATSSSGAAATWTDPTATDLGGVATGPSCSPASGSSFAFGSTTVTCSATDNAGNTKSATFSVTVQDTTDPLITGGAGTTLEATGPLTTATYTEPTATDTADDSVPVGCVPSSGSDFPVGTTTVTCTATDDSGNSSTADLDVVITDTTGPAISVSDVEDVEATGPGGASVSFSPTANDLVDGDRPVNCDYDSGDTFAIGTTTVTCTAEDTRGNLSTESFTVEVVDTTDPELTVPGDGTVEATGPSGATVDFAGDVSATDVVDTAVDVSCIPPSGSTFGVGDTLVTCTAVDDSGNDVEGSFTVTVVDDTDPELTVPDDRTVEATGPSGATVDFAGDVSATDVVDTDVDVSCDPPSGSTFGLGDTLVTCTATDDSGNADGGSFTVTVVDTTDPVLTVPDDRTVEATGPSGATVGFAGGVSATDTVDTDVDVSCDPPSGSTFSLGSTTVTCTATDDSGNDVEGSFTISVVDTTAPDVTVPDDITEEATGPDGAVVGFTSTATDIVDGELDPSCVPPSGSTFPLGDTTVTCSATDAADNTGSNSFLVTVEDTTDPELTVPDDRTVEATGPAGATVGFAGDVSATDIVDTDVDVSCDPPSGSTFPIGDSVVNCTATDDSGNDVSASFTISVVDTTAPDVTVPDDITAEATGPDGAVVGFASSATDIVDGELDPSCVPPSGSTFPLETTTVTCSATDAADNTGSASFLVTVVDTTDPVLTVPDDRTVEATGPSGATVGFAGGVSATDTVDTDVDVSCDPPSGSTFSLGSTTVTCTATDDSGNDVEGSFTISVVDTTAPDVTVPDDITEEATGPDGAVVGFTSTATDIVDGEPDPSCVPPSGSTFPLGTTEVTCSATDAALNTGSNSFFVTVEDTTGPELDLPANITTGATSAAGATVNFSATATDLVDGSVPVDCTPHSGSTFAPGTTTVNCSATDAASNTTNGSFAVTVNFDWTGFFAPVDNEGVLNVIKGGQSVPMKWRISDGSGGWVSSLSVVEKVTQAKITCANTLPTDEIEAPTSGATSLRYDTTANQYIYNWQSPKGAGVCYRVTVYLTDDTTHSALFKTK